MNALSTYKKQLEAYAKMAEGYERETRDKKVINFWADKYCESKANKDEYGMNIYFSALMLKFWNQISNMYEKTKTANMYAYEDYSSILAKCINIACEYWSSKSEDERSKTNAQAFINQIIASRGVAEIMYDANRDSYKANACTVSIDQPMSNDEDADTLLDVVEDENESPAKHESSLAVNSIIQNYIDKNKVVEAIILDTIAYNDCNKHTKVTKKYHNDETDEDYKVSTDHEEFWPYRTVQILSSLPADYEEYFESKYEISGEKVEAAVGAIRKAPNTKLYKYLDNTLKSARLDYKSGRI